MLKILFIFITLSFTTFAKERLPIVFVHGIWINAEAYEYFIPMKKIFKKFGYDVLVAKTPIGNSLEERAKVLNQEINRLVPKGRYHLMGHSMGGLDSRLAIYQYNLSERCASLTTISTPHRGSYVADYVITHYGQSLAMDLLEKVFKNDIRAVNQLTTTHMSSTFNQNIQNDPRVKYFSMGFYIPSPVHQHSVIPWLWIAHAIQVNSGAKQSDGMVSVESASWGKILGVMAGDHYSETAPFPMSGKLMYEDVFKIVAQNLDQNF